MYLNAQVKKQKESGNSPIRKNEMACAYFIEYVRRRSKAVRIGLLYSGGINIYTTLNDDLQDMLNRRSDRGGEH
jgi:membrane carboxypeptidase/penicillin-binding protein